MRARRNDESSRNYDSVLDTMTNVVGILIIIVALAQVGVSSAIAKVKGVERTNVPSRVTTAVLETTREDRDRARLALAELREKWGDLEASAPEARREISRIRKLIEALEREAASATDFRERLLKLEGSQGQLTDAIAALERERSQVEADLERLRQRVAEAPERRAEDTAVRVPYPDPSRAKGKSMSQYYCRGGRLVPINDPVLNARRRAGMAEVLHGKTRLSDDDVLGLCVHFLNNEIGDEYFRLRLLTNPRLDTLTVKYEMRDDAPHDTHAKIVEAESRFKVGLDSQDPEKVWLYFYVWDDSFDVYLEARRIAEKAGFSVGWIAYAEDEELQSTIMGGSGGGRRALPD